MELKGKNGYNISYEETIPENPDVIVVAMHGFAGDKESGFIKELEKEVNNRNCGLIRFDWPGHGESEANGDNLTIKNCVSDIKSIIEHIKERYPESKLVACSTSFGGYLTLVYNSLYPEEFEHLILRSPAIKMYDVLNNNIMTREHKNDLNTNGYFEYGFERLLKVNKKLLDELYFYNISKMYDKNICDNISIIHGTNDDVVPYEDSLEFSEIHKCSLTPIIGADHRYKKDGELEQVINASINIIENIQKEKRMIV